MLDLADKFREVALLDDAQASALDRHAQATRGEGADEHQLLGVLADIDEAAGARQARPEFADVQIAFAVGLCEPEKGGVEPAAVIKVELIRLIDDGLRVDRRSELSPPAGTPPITPGSAVSVSKSAIFSSSATAATPSGMPMPRLTTLLASSSSAALLAMILRSLISIEAAELAGARISPLKAGSYCTEKVCQ